MTSVASTQKGYKGMGMEGPIARWYEKNTRRDMAEYRKFAERLKAGLPQGGDVLEVAPGPGFLSVEMAKGGKVRITGLDISRTFVEIARKNAAETGVKADFVLGNASAMPFADNSFDLLVCRAAFKNFSEPLKALREMHRVLRPGGTAVVADLCRDTPMSAVRNYVNGLDVSAINRWMIKATFRFMLLKRAYTKQEFEQMVSAIPFKKVEIRQSPEGMGMEVWMTK
jgi:ubiquinone/menaquinone biosynthesis C-methylase UbiE